MVRLTVGTDGHRYVENLTITTRQRLVAGEVKAVGIAVKGLYGQRMSGGTLSLHHVGGINRESIGEMNHYGHTIDIFGVLKEHGIDHRLASHTVGRHTIDADVLCGALSRLVGASGIIIVAVVGYQLHILGGDGQRVVAAGRYHLTAAGPVLKCVPLVVIGAEGLLCTLFKLVAALGVEITAICWVGCQEYAVVDFLRCRFTRLTGAARSIGEVSHQTVGVGTSQHDIVKGAAFRNNLVVLRPVDKGEIRCRVSLHTHGRPHFVCRTRRDVEATATRRLGGKPQVSIDGLGGNVRFGGFRGTSRRVCVVGNERHGVAGHGVLEAVAGRDDLTVQSPLHEREVGGSVRLHPECLTLSMVRRGVQVEAASPRRVGLERQRVVRDGCSWLGRVRRVVLPPCAGTHYECQRHEYILETSHRCTDLLFLFTRCLLVHHLAAVLDVDAFLSSCSLAALQIIPITI